MLEPLLLPKVWGGRALSAYGLALPAGEAIGEAWLVADLRTTSVSGAGGGAMQSPVRGAADTTLGALADLAPARWCGTGHRAAEGFPLLVKLLDAREHLSVQVHPSVPYAAAHAHAAIKHECWYVLAAEPGAVLFLGVRAGVTRDALASAARAGRVAELLHVVPAVAGECHLLPSGLVHALGAGVVVAEVQTPSDTTYRLYDWTREYGRAERALHLDEALAAADLRLDAVTRRPIDAADALAADGERFVVHVRRWTRAAPPERLPMTVGQPMIVVVLRGVVRMRVGDWDALLAAGTSVVVAADAEAVVLSAAEAAEVLTAQPR